MLHPSRRSSPETRGLQQKKSAMEKLYQRAYMASTLCYNFTTTSPLSYVKLLLALRLIDACVKEDVSDTILMKRGSIQYFNYGYVVNVIVKGLNETPGFQGGGRGSWRIVRAMFGVYTDHNMDDELPYGMKNELINRVLEVSPQTFLPCGCYLLMTGNRNEIAMDLERLVTHSSLCMANASIAVVGGWPIDVFQLTETFCVILREQYTLFMKHLKQVNAPRMSHLFTMLAGSLTKGRPNDELLYCHHHISEMVMAGFMARSKEVQKLNGVFASNSVSFPCNPPPSMFYVPAAYVPTPGNFAMMTVDPPVYPHMYCSS